MMATVDHPAIAGPTTCRSPIVRGRMEIRTYVRGRQLTQERSSCVTVDGSRTQGSAVFELALNLEGAEVLHNLHDCVIGETFGTPCGNLNLNL
jgi:hypothetical protein